MSAGGTGRATPMAGHLAGNWVGLGNDGAQPPVVLNGQTTDMDLMAWLWGEVESLLTTVRMLADGGVDLEPQHLNAIVVHRLEPMATALEFSVSQGLASRKTTTGEPA